MIVLDAAAAVPDGDLRAQWLAACVSMAREPAEFYSGARKIHTGVTIQFGALDQSLRIEDAGFTKIKLGMLRRLYWDDEHAEAVAGLWRGRLERAKYGSVSASTYHHLTKADPEKRSKRASVMGPCLLGVAATLLSRDVVVVDAMYRTTELFKKFPADLVFIRDTVLPAIGIDAGAIARLRCHFANVTSHPMYAVTWLALIDEPIDALEGVKTADRKFYDWCIKWTGRYICPENHRGIAKFAQALRVKKDALARITGDRLEALQEYVRGNHPGYRNDYQEDENDDSE